MQRSIFRLIDWQTLDFCDICGYGIAYSLNQLIREDCMGKDPLPEALPRNDVSTSSVSLKKESARGAMRESDTASRALL